MLESGNAITKAVFQLRCVEYIKRLVILGSKHLLIDLQVVRARSITSCSITDQCEHIQLVQKEHGHSFNDEDPIQLEPSKLEDLAIPLRYKSQMLSLYKQCPHLVQKVASETFAIRCSQESQEHPLGLVHVHLQKQVTAGPTSQKYHNPFHCPCNSFRQYTRHFPGSSSTSKPSPRCIHFYLCI